MIRSIALLLLLITMLLVACNGDDDNSSDTSPEETTQSPESPPPTSADVTLQTETVWVVSGEQPVDVYDCPDTSCEVVDTLFPGTVLDVVSTEDDWHEILLSDAQTAYIEVSKTHEETRPVPPEDSSFPPGVTPSDGTVESSGPPPLSAPPGQPTLSGTFTTPTFGPPSNSSLPPGVPTQDGTTTAPRSDSGGPPNVTSQPPPGVSE